MHLHTKLCNKKDLGKDKINYKVQLVIENRVKGGENNKHSNDSLHFGLTSHVGNANQRLE